MRQKHTSKHNKHRITALTALLLGTATVSAMAQNAGAAGGGAAGVGATGTAGAAGAAGAGAPGAATGAGAPGAAPGAVGAVGAGTGVSGNTGTMGTTGMGTANGTGVSGSNGVSAGTTGTEAGTGTAPGGSVPVSSNPAPQQYDLSRTIADALQASADVQTAERNVQIDQKRADQAAARGRPNVNAVGSATRFDQATKVAIGNSPPIQVLGSHTELLQLNLSDQLDITGQIRNAENQYRLRSQADRYFLQQVSNARVLRAQTVYFNLLQTNHEVQVAQANLINAQQNQTEAQQQYAAGTGLKLNVLRANTQVAQAQQQLNQAQNNNAIAESTFNDLVGRPLNTPITLNDVPGVAVGVPPTLASPTAVGAPSAQPLYTTPDVSGISLSQSQQTAAANRPELLADQINTQVAALGVTLARAGFQPTLSVDAAGNYYPTTSFQTPRQRTAQITATLTIPIYDGNATHDLVEEARLEQKNAQTALASERADVALDVNQAYLNLTTAATQITAADSELTAAIAAWQNAEVRFQGGVGLYLEVTDAQAALVQAQNSQINAVYNYLIARAQFENAIGTPQAH